MNEKAKQMRREYKRAWNRANRDKVRASQERYWNKKAAEHESNISLSVNDPVKEEA